MAVTAVAGGSGRMDRTIVEQLVASGKHDVNILARKPNAEIETEFGVPVITVDYANVEALKNTLEVNKSETVISAIMVLPVFLDCWGIPVVNSHFPSASMVIDIVNDVAAIPGDGNQPIVFTHSVEVAKFVVAMLDAKEWDPISYTVGDKITWNEFLQLAEEVKGTKFSTTYDSIEKLKQGETTEFPVHVAKVLNDQFPEIKAMTVKDLLERAWRKS
ncbi:hypothetical protein GGR57DRAFT_503281 [Xylariaceae sp. FL1272]|nr:hypothetical protein GGR57DRAFT_503281 [Xylariaceae sp. FL1272]